MHKLLMVLFDRTISHLPVCIVTLYVQNALDEKNTEIDALVLRIVSYMPN